MSEDKGKHYRYTYRGIKLDPYRICQVYEMGGGPREHMTKKLLRGTHKGHEEIQLLDELQSSLDRWREMIEEDRKVYELQGIMNYDDVPAMPENTAEKYTLPKDFLIPNPGVET